MSPTIKREAGVAAQAKPSRFSEGPKTTDGEQLEEKLAAPMRAMDRMMSILGNISDRINRFESPQRSETTKTAKKPRESLFGYVLGAGMTIQALDGPPL